jgi:predicted secreted protein
MPITAMLALAAAFTAIPLVSHAGDAAQLEVLGFSEDGKFFAFEQYGNQDGSGAAYSWIDFYDLAEGRYADETRRVMVGGREGDDLDVEATRSKARTEAAETLERLGIRVGNTGKQVVWRPLTDLDADSTSARFSVWTPLEGMISQDYTLELVSFPTKSERCYFDEQAYMFDLHLIDNSSGEKIILHHDDYLPDNRHCALAYRIAGVVVFEPVSKRDVAGIPIVVVINIFSTGFEGHDMRFTVVGGTLN